VLLLHVVEAVFGLFVFGCIAFVVFTYAHAFGPAAL
jgi:hypothetical protein